jgi:TonB family protein
MRLPDLNSQKFILLFSLLVLSNTVFGKAALLESKFNQDIETDSVYAVVEKDPEFPGGEAARIDYIKQNIKYPADAQQRHLDGKVNVQFVVSSIGQVIDAKVVKKLAPSFDEEALRVVNSFPKWIPGELNGKKVPVYRIIQVAFKYTPVPNSEESWKLSDSTLIVIDSLKMPLKFNIEVVDVERIDTGFILKPFPEEAKNKLIQQYGPDARNGVLLLKTYDIKNFNNDTTNVKVGDENYVFKETDKMPQFPGGEVGLMCYVDKNLQYPRIALENGIQGKVIVRFVVDRMGKVKDPRVVTSIDPILDFEALRIVKSLPDWLPGEINGRKVNVYCVLPVSFKQEGSGGYQRGNLNVVEKSLIILDGQHLPFGFDINWLNFHKLQTYNPVKPKNNEEKKQLIDNYGENAVNGVIVINSYQNNSLYRKATNERSIAERTDSLGKPIYDVIEQMPLYPGGEGALLKFIGRNLKYPSIAQTTKIQGTVIVRFVVNSLGNIERTEVLRGLSPECDKEAIRVISMLPTWIPGKQKGVAVSVYLTLPIKFVLM